MGSASKTDCSCFATYRVLGFTKGRSVVLLALLLLLLSEAEQKLSRREH